MELMKYSIKMKDNLSKIFAALVIAWVLSSCSDSKGDDLSFRNETCTVINFDIENIGYRYSGQGQDFDIISVYKVPTFYHDEFVGTLSARNDTADICGYWEVDERYAFYHAHDRVKKNGEFYEMEYSFKLNTLIVRKIIM
ncbi:MAG: hypothetical protein ACI865_000238 [Flavobacteriaceae bacterium]|jgi:hypothetical protein